MLIKRSREEQVIQVLSNEEKQEKLASDKMDEAMKRYGELLSNDIKEEDKSNS